LAEAANQGTDVGPAGEWLLDNFHVIQEHIHEVRESLPRGYYHELPEIATGNLAGYPRVYELAITLISHTEGRIDLENVDRFVGAFQEVAALSIGELWAVPAMLRLGLIENVRRMALRTAHRLDEISRADEWAARILAAAEQGTSVLGDVLDHFVKDPPTLTPFFVSRLLLQLRLTRGAFPPLLSLEQWIADEGMSAEDAGARSTQRLALTQLVMANSITSLRAIGHMSWRIFVERQSVMEAVLRKDPSGFYPRMTFATRDRYRHVVEQIVKRTRSEETQVAGHAINLAAAGAADSSGDPRLSHIGYYLIDRGLPRLEQLTGYRPTLWESVHRWVLRHPNAVFGGGLLFMVLVVLAVPFWLASPNGWPAWLAVLLFAFLPAFDIAVGVVNQLVTAFLPPRVLPQLDLYGQGIPAEFRTAVVIPTLFGSVDAVQEALENLEVQFLANREAHLHFAILSDFTDAPAETQPTDAAILETAIEGVRSLNARYGGGAAESFYLFHRPRRWNPEQGAWMGWERKRGKLAEFNRFIRGGAEGAFSTVIGDVEPLRLVRYVITLDSDTVLPPDSAPLLVGALAHPLNRAWYDPARGRVVRGYGILQPRVGVSLRSAYRSRFAAIHSGHPGVDPYTTAVSDVYQDLYGEGSFTGKGIYDVDAFEQATQGRFPDNTLLSHDLIEGSYARAGLATDITVYDDYPTRYFTYAQRKHRWIRGDWQLLPWLTRRVPGPEGTEPNRLSLLSRWKILDNLRRSTVELSQLALLLAGWTILPGSPITWTILGLAAIAAPWLVALLLAAFRPPLDKSWRAYYAAIGRDAVTSAQQLALTLTVLPHQAYISVDAIVRTLWRLFVSRRHLLEWQTASTAEHQAPSQARAVWQAMWPTIAICGGILILVTVFALPLRDGDRIWPLAVTVLPLVALWAVSPGIAHALSSPAVRRVWRLPRDLRRAAMRYALLHWRFFDRFVTAETQWLAPDNFQEDPLPVIAMRTSPTNIGLQLLATVSAHDLGFLTIGEMIRRLEQAFRSLERMRRFRGHFFNWYDLHDLHVLEPAYISTVDSGNLAGHLVALRQACLALRDQPASAPRIWLALEVALSMALERMRDLPPPSPTSPPISPRAAAMVEQRLRETHAVVKALGKGAENRRPDASRAPPDDDATEALNDLAARFRELGELLLTTGLPPRSAESVAEWVDWCTLLVANHQAQGSRPASSTLDASAVSRLEAIADRAYSYAMEMDFQFLFDPSRKLFAIGYQHGAHSLDTSFYDLLASEARLASFIAIAKNDVPVEHWLHLDRTLNHVAGETALVSWSGSMFEYLMPALVMQSFPFTILDQTCRGAVQRHIAYGNERGVPWGVSESAYNLRDRHLTYQYRAFGVPDLALKRGLGRELVVAPYASALAIMIEPDRALANLGVLEEYGALGPWGFRDALDFTRPLQGQRYSVVQTFMAHHLGMSFVAITNALMTGLWQRRFHNDPIVRSAELLLHERIPRRLVWQEPPPVNVAYTLPPAEADRPAVREVETPHTPQPSVALLGHLPYTIMLSHCGSGYSRFEDLAVTRWRSDGTRDDTGQFCYVKDVGRERTWSAAHQPVCAPADWYRALLAADRVTFHRADGPIETLTEIAVVPQDSAEVRRITLTNNGDEPCEVEVTSYGEVVLAPPAADRVHPAFGNLFVETEWHEWCTAITATRRPRSSTERPVWCVHVVDTGNDRVGAVSCETDRSRFLGRGRSVRDPVVLEHDGALSNTTGAVLDPIVALRTRVRLVPGRSTSVAFTTLVATTRERAFELAGRYHDPHAAQRALDLAWTATQIELRELGITPADAAVFQEIAGHLFFSTQTMRAPQAEILKNRGSQQRLWAQGVSGDWPIVVATISSSDGLPTLRQLFSAHRYWRRRGMTVDLVVLIENRPSYLQELTNQITEAMFATSDSGMADRPGGVFIRRSDILPPDDLLMLRATARVHVPCDGRSLHRIVRAAQESEAIELEEQEPALRTAERSTLPLASVVQRLRASASSAIAPFTASLRVARPTAGPAPGAGKRSPLLQDNGLGGIAPNGDYQIRVQGDKLPPAPWANVIANARGGFLVTERGAGATWAENSLFFRLTPWHNDPVSDPISEAIYLRDEESGELWSATPAPIRQETPYVVRHRPGSTTFEHDHGGIVSHLTLGLAPEEAVKISVLRVTNRSSVSRRIGLTAYVEWTLGVLREHTQHQVRTAFDPQNQAIMARNTFDQQFGEWHAFLAMTEPLTSYTADRREFLGRNGSVSVPAALIHPDRPPLAGSTGTRDPCAALQCLLELKPGETREVVVLLGGVRGEAEARDALRRYRNVAASLEAVDRTVQEWADRLSVIAVRTPEPSFDAMINRWTLYQALACRMWGRTAVYQSSGAYGFRDQLQDVMALVYAEPGLAREHILRATARQFEEGDVQHWWHPESGRGVRTRFSDDLVWLPYVVEHYVRVTGDASILDEKVPFLSMRPLADHEHEVYDLPQVTEETESVYQHCLRALRRACTSGEHHLPLIGSGDWNDGMNRVGIEGRGESVWLAWFLVTTLRGFVPIVEKQGETEVAGEFMVLANEYVAAIESQGWDGAWYRRAYFDDGTPLGSASNEECRIDSIAQSWSVISGAGDPGRQATAMRSLEEHLVRKDARLLMLLTPAFDKSPHDPGYIKGYLPGVRENGAQYTHAALWAVLATALRGDGNRAFELYQMINPLTRADTPAGVDIYKVEPYVVAADIYTAKGHLGRGGWTWYTGSASWMYRVGLEGILGFTKRGDSLFLDPCVPDSWPEYTIEYRYGKSVYVITVENPAGMALQPGQVIVDGKALDALAIPLVNDGERHVVVVRPAPPLQPG
jgi:cyclic beta-1,2-glucan synthetase